MKTYFRDPHVEEAPRNIILQNRCGNRLTLQFFENSTELEFVYKPNAYRRKDLHARNFSNRDNFTALFESFSLPYIPLAHITDFDYDPFVTRLTTCAPSLARNTITVVNIADHNVFALAARAPLLMGIRPHRELTVRDGLLMEHFSDRGEHIVSFVGFAGLDDNRYRVLDDGTHVLQAFENEVVLVGGEETEFHALMSLKALTGMSLEELRERNERRVAPALAKGRLQVTAERFQRVLDATGGLVFSGIDGGGPFFGAVNRLYHLIWVRDGAMTTSLMARSGNPDYLRTFAPFLLNNPSPVRRPDGTLVREFLQIIGSRWTQSEDDGIFYAVLTLFTHFVTTGDDSLVQGPEFETVLEATDRFLEKGWEPDRGLVGSDTRGESPLASNPYFGYDTVNGKIHPAKGHEGAGNEQTVRLSRCYSLYNNVNTFNLLTMALIMLRQRPTLGADRRERYAGIAEHLRRTITTDFVDPDGNLYNSYERYTDGSEAWKLYSKGSDYWEYGWAVSLGPFYPAPALQLRSARLAHERWPTMAKYGFCPWNTLARMLREYGMSTHAYHEMLTPEIDDALTLSERYPMQGSLGEYISCVNDPKDLYRSWRALPFTAGSLFYSATALLIQSLPMGIAVRASGMADRIDDYQYRLARLSVHCTEEGDDVATVMVNNEPLEGTLQIPEGMLRPGANTVEVSRGAHHTAPRLYSSSAELLSCRATARGFTYALYSPVPAQLVFVNYDRISSITVVQGERELPTEASPIADSGKTLLYAAATDGDFEVRLEMS